LKGATHLFFGMAFGTAALVALTVKHDSCATTHLLCSVMPRPYNTLPGRMEWIRWPAIAVAGAVGGLLPDIDQPGSLITRLPARQERVLRSLLKPMRGTSIGQVLQKGLGALGILAGALLGSSTGRRSFGRFASASLAVILGVLTLLCWKAQGPPMRSWSVGTRATMSTLLASLCALSLLLAFGGIAGLINRLPGHHRGWTHSLPFAILVSGAALFYLPILAPGMPGLGLAFAVGYVSHLIADALTIRGIPLWWPGKGKSSLHLLPKTFRVRTGGKGEVLFNVLWLIGLSIGMLILAR